MNITKMSLVAALLIGSSAMALDNTKVSGDANLYYQTSDASGGDFLESGSSLADMSVNLNLTTDVYKSDKVAVSAGLGYTVLTTLGLEGQLVDGTWAGAHDATGVDTVSWVNEAWFATTAAKTTVKVGRMELDTPLAFTEQWSIEKNTFEAAVLINQDIKDTTIVGAYVGRGNGSDVTDNGVVATGGEFSNYGGKGAYVLGAINNSWKPLTAQAWFYDVVRHATATWFQGDLDLSTVGAKGVTLGAQYTTLSAGDTDAYAAMVGYSAKSLSAKLSYSQVSKNGAAGYNTATGATNGQTKLYTETWWNYGNVTKADARTVNLTVEAPTSVADLGLYVTMVDHQAVRADLTEYTASASKSMGPVDASLVYIHTDMPETGTAGDNTVQVYLTANF